MNFSFEIYQPVARVSLLYFPCVFIVVVFFKSKPGYSFLWTAFARTCWNFSVFVFVPFFSPIVTDEVWRSKVRALCLEAVDGLLVEN